MCENIIKPIKKKLQHAVLYEIVQEVILSLHFSFKRIFYSTLLIFVKNNCVEKESD